MMGDAICQMCIRDSYSMGMRQRLAIAQAIMEDPDILLLDEPMNGLDNAGVCEMRELFKSLRDQGKTILLASHNPLDIEELCDTVCEMDGGVLTRVRSWLERWFKIHVAPCNYVVEMYKLFCLRRYAFVKSRVQ